MYDDDGDKNPSYLCGGVTLQVADVVDLQLPPNRGLFNDGSKNSTFSGSQPV